MRKLTDNEEMERECGNGKRMSKWRENEEIKRIKFLTFCHKILKYVTFCRKMLKFGTFCRECRKNLNIRGMRK